MSVASRNLSNAVVQRLTEGGDPNALFENADLACQLDPLDYHGWYARGLACRAKRAYAEAEGALAHADELSPDLDTVLLALAIAQQLQHKYRDAVETLRRLLTKYPNHVLAYNTLGLTQKLMGEPEKAAYNFCEGLRHLVTEWGVALVNSAQSLRFPPFAPRRSLYLEYARDAMLARTALDGLDTCAFPTAEMAEADSRDARFAGWFWEDARTETGRSSRLWLPNAFNTCAAYLRHDRRYATLTGNRATVLQLLGKDVEAQAHLEEAEDFSR